VAKKAEAMIPITGTESAAQAKYEIERALLNGASWQLATEQAPPVTLERGGYDLSVEWGKLIFAWWDEDRSQSWQVTAYEVGEAEVRLRAVRGVAREQATFILRDAARLGTRPSGGELTVAERRSRYAAALPHLILRQVNRARLRRVSTQGSRPSSLPGHYTRLVLEVNGETALAIGVNESEDQATIDGAVAAGLYWLARFNERRTGEQRARQLWFCVPHGRSQTVIERLTFIDLSHLSARVACFEVEEAREKLSAVRPATQDELLSAPPRELGWPRESAAPSRWRERIRHLAPELIEVREHIGRDAESYCIHGLEFAYAGGRGQVRFGVMSRAREDEQSVTARELSASSRHSPAQARRERAEWRKSKALTEANFGELERLVREIAAHRSAQPPDRAHPFYRLRAEAWLESLLRRDLRALDVTLDERYVYSQIPAWRAEQRSVIDLLAVNRHGRLVVIEIKAAEDPYLPLQGLDYWLRVEQARGRGELARRGLFPGLRLAEETPLLYLVAPRLRFHRSFSAVARCLSPQVEAYRLGLNETWRAGVRLHARERVNEREK
jgi:hypothetical protein